MRSIFTSKHFSSHSASVSAIVSKSAPSSVFAGKPSFSAVHFWGKNYCKSEFKV